jgi:predicted anti-sigma-YlaC factor YlaD
MHCHEAHTLIELALDDGVELEETLLAHLTACPGCRARYDAGRELVGLLEHEAELPLASAPRVTRERVFGETDGRAQKMRRSRVTRPLLAAAAALLIGLTIRAVSPVPGGRAELTDDELAALEVLRSARDDAVGTLLGNAGATDAPGAFDPFAPRNLLAHQLESLEGEVRRAEALLLRLLSLAQHVDQG